MPKGARWGSSAIVALFWMMVSAGACNLIAGLDDIHVQGNGGAGGQGQPCSADNQCNDENPCTIDACGEQGTCTASAVPDGDAPEQIPNDCKKAVCAAGKATEVADDTDFLDDSNDCTTDACVNGASANTAKADNTPCTVTVTNEPGVCNSGVCNATCSAQKPCQQVGFCADVVCDTSIGQCITTNKPDGLPTPTQVPGDCAIKVCNGGMEIETPDDTDVPDDNNDCTADGCAGGMPASTDKAQSTVCATGFCDGAGTCVTCTKDSECPTFTSDNACQTTTCTANHTCMVVQPAMGFVIAGQTAGDCKENRCDGMGNVVSLNVNDPSNDNNECTDDGCVNGLPTFTPVALPQACTGGLCNAQGQCGCASNADCTAPNKCNAGACSCISDTCASKGYTCGTASDGCFATLACDTGTKNGSETDVDCGGSVAACATRCGLGKACVVAADCASGFCADGVCCDTACNTTCSACTAAKKGGGQDGVCGTVGNGFGDPDTCGTLGCNNGSCGSKKANGLICGNNADCQSGQCKDGFCCNNSCGGACRACSAVKTGVINGTCGFITAGTDPDNECSAATPNCNGAGACQ